MKRGNEGKPELKTHREAPSGASSTTEPGDFLARRRELVYNALAQEGIALVMFEDREGRRDSALRWLSGHSGDALLFLTVDKKSLLVPWDLNMAKLYGRVDLIIPYAEFERRPIKALRGAAELLKVPQGSRMELSEGTSYLEFLHYVEALGEYDVICREQGIHEMVGAFRSVKDPEEIAILKEGARITNEILDELEEGIRGGKFPTELDVALYIEQAGRLRGCEGLGFETLAAGAGRSFGIHAFPAYTVEPFGNPGLSILDFGLKYRGYTTDVTLTVCQGPLTRSQERMLSLTERAYKLALSLCVPGASCREIALAVDELFAKGRQVMPHALGHGIGLEAHEAPLLRSRADNPWFLAPGMVLTLEPGLYDSVQGGCRLENDILITETGHEVLTRSRIIRL